MTIELADGTIIPSELSVRGVDSGMGYLEDLSNTMLRVGEVRELIYKTDHRSLSKSVIEYRVAVQHRGMGGDPGISTEYPNCFVSNTFGSVADQVRYSLRSDNAPNKDGLGVGAKVLLLCVNGQTSHAVILGGIRDQADPNIDKEEDGHFFFFEFNGLAAGVNQHGELKVQFRGRTDAKNQIDTKNGADKNAQPTTVQILKTGNFEITTKDENQFIKIDHENKKTSTLADTEWNFTVNGDWVGKIGKKWSLKCDSSVDFNISSDFTIKSAGVQVGSGSNKWPLFSTYRGQEQAFHADISTGLSALSAQLGVAGTAFSAAAVAMKVPIAGPIAASVPIQAAGAALTAAVGAIAIMLKAIVSFEVQAPSYLSLKNTND